MPSPPLPSGVQPPAFKTPFFNKEHQIDPEWKRCFLSWQTAITALLQFTQHIGGNQGLLAIDDPDAGEPLLAITAPPSPPSVPTALPSVAAGLLLDDADAGEVFVAVLPGGVGSIGGPFTQGSVIFAGPGGLLAQDNPKFFWDDTNFALGIGTTTPSTDLAGSGIEVKATQANVIVVGSSTTGTNSIQAVNDLSNELLFVQYGSAKTGTTFGLSNNNLAAWEAFGGSALVIGITVANPLILGTNSLERMRITGAGLVGINTTPAWQFHVVGPGGAAAGSLATLITDNNSHDGMNMAIGWTGAGANNKYKAFSIDSNGFHIGHMTDALNASPTLDFSISNAGVCKAETEMQSVLYDFGASTCHLKGDGGDGILHLLDSAEATFSYILLGKTDATGVRIQFNASTGITLVNGNNSLFVRLQCGNLNLQGTVTNYNAVTTAGLGVPAIYGSGRSTAQTAAVASVAAYTVGAADGSFEVSANVLVTTSTTHNFTVTCAYTDEGNTARTLTMAFMLLAGTLTTAIVNGNGAVPYMGWPTAIRCKALTSITIATTGTFTTVTYNVEGFIKQLS